MKPHPCELEFHQTTEGEFAKTVKIGGWIECVWRCYVMGCEERFPHRHYICENGHIDFAEPETCFDCWHMSELRDIRLWLLENFTKKHGRTLIRLGMCLVAILTFTIANWRFR